MNGRKFLLNCLLIVALLLGSVVPLAAAPAPVPVSLPAAEADAPIEPTATDVFAPYAHWQGSADAYISVPHDDALFPQTGATFEAWVFLSNTSGCRNIFSTGYTQGYWVGVCNGRIRYASGAAATYTEGTAVILPNVWTHIAVVWDPVQNVRRFFINGDFDVLAAAGPAPMGTQNLRIGGAIPSDVFLGFLAEARIWNVARDQADIRRTMHSYLEEKMPGLVAAWPFRTNHTDVIGGLVGTPTGTQQGILFVGTDAVHPFPLRPQTLPADDLFNSLPHRRDSMGSAYLPGWDRLLLIGGSVNNSTESNRIDAIDGGTGDFTTLGTLPVTLRNPGAAYAPETGNVYVFGGASGGADQSAIYAINPTTGAVTTLAATLPAAVNAPTSVYHPGLGKIFVLGGVVVGGTTPVDSVSVFDPITESVTPANFALPARRFMLAAAYSSATDSIFTFGGIGDGGVLTNGIYQLQATGDGATGSITPAPVSLSVADGGLAAVEDGASKLIYLLGGSLSDRVWAFDPVLGQLWRTPGELSALRYRPAALYSPANRHALLVGGFAGAVGHTNVWKFDLGDGPSVKLGHWAFDTAGAAVRDIDGAADRIVVGTANGAMARTNNGTILYTPDDLGGTNVGLVRYDPTSGRTWFGLVDSFNQDGIKFNNRVVYSDGGAVVPFWSDLGTGSSLSDFNPYGTTQVIAKNVDITTSGGHSTLFWRWGFGSNQFWGSNWDGCFSSSDLVVRGPGQIWGLRTQYTCGPRAIGPEPRQVDLPDQNVYLRGLTYNTFTGQATEQEYGIICPSNTLRPNGMAFGQNGDLWVSGSTGVCRYPATTIPGTAAPAFNLMEDMPTGVGANAPSVDRDGRVWFGLTSDTAHSGGLTVFEVLGKDPTRQSVWTTDYTWLNAPIGSKNASGTQDYDSSVGAVSAIGERVWSARGSQIFTIAQRWQQLSEGNNLRGKALTGIWAVRGRLFVATADELAILQPDGISWENWAVAGVKAVAADKAGRIWVGGAKGVGIYTGPGGFVTPPSPTPASAGPVSALAVDSAGRVWIGGGAGVTLYDRGRFVTTLTPATGGAVSSLLADRNDNLWVGTNAGLNRFSRAEAAWTTFTTANGLPSNDIGDVVQLPNGWLAIAHSAGVTQYRSDTDFVGYSISGNKLPLTVDDKGQLWAGSNMVENDIWVNYTWANSGLAANAVADSAADGADRVWFAHPGGGVSVRGSTLPPLAEQVPVITGINPTSGSAGQDIHILGSGFGTSTDALEVTIGGKPVTVRAATDTDVTVILGPDNTSGRVSLVKNRKRRTTASNVFCAIPVISDVLPRGGNVGVEIGVKGTNFDPDAAISLGSAHRSPRLISTQTMTTVIESSDASGSVTVRNACVDSQPWKIPFRKIDLSINQLVLSQGLPDQPLLHDRPTMIQNFLQASVSKRVSDTLSIDQAVVTFTDPATGRAWRRVYPYGGAVPALLSDTPSFIMEHLNNSVNLANVTPFLGHDFRRGDVQVQVELLKSGRLVAQSSRTVRFERNVTLRVILVPIMFKGRGDLLGADVRALQSVINRDLEDLRRRIMPTGDVEFVWSTDVIVHDSEIDLDSWRQLFDFSHQLDRARTRWNDRTVHDALIAFGVVDPLLVVGKKDGKGFWPGLTDMLNVLGLDVLDTLCDVGNEVVNTVSFGLLGSDEGCGLNIPTFIAWGKGYSGWNNGYTTASSLFGHEIGHTLGLVQVWAANGSIHDNESHSVNDEIGPKGTISVASKSCTESGDPAAFFDPNLSFYWQSGVRAPVVNAITGAQLRPNWGSGFNGYRAKSIMSYACGRTNDSAFFEPVDEEMIRLVMGDAGLPVGSGWPNAREGKTMQPRSVPGPRLHVSGTVNRQTNAGEFARVENLSADAPLSPGFNTGYWLVQVDSGGNELDRLGIYPLFEVIDHSDGAAPSTPDGLGFFAATLRRADGVAGLQLRQGESVLATFAPGSNPPQVQITAPAGGAAVNGGSLAVAWTASDSDGDALEIAVDYSADSGVNWTPVGSATGAGAGSLDVLAAVLAGSGDARVRVSASDGFQTVSATSAAFSVAAQPPSVYISQPTAGATVGEAELVQLMGGASDNQDGWLTGAALVWRSDRDGELGNGEMVDTFLSVGSHTLTLRAVNSDGLAVEASVAVTVAGDYDGDSILDTEEAAENLNPLTDADALGDTDGDGLSLRVERLWGTDPNKPDSDGDGRNDSEEIAAGTDPAAGDAPLPADLLQVFPPALEFHADLSQDTLPAQQFLQIVSREPVSWTLSLGAGWLRSTQSSGQTPGVQTIWVQPAALADGVHTGSLLVSSSLGDVTVPVTVTVSNKMNYCDVNGDSVTDQADVDGVTLRVGSQAGDVNYHYRYDLNRDGVINGQDVTLVTACLAGEAPTYRLYLPSTVRETVSAPVDLLLYRDELAQGWENWSWSSTVDLTSVGQVRVGTNAVAITHTAAHGGFSLRAATPLNANPYSAIRFWIYGNGQPLALYIQASDDGPASPFYRFTPPAGVWARYRAPLSALGNPAAIARINLQDDSGAPQPTYFLDELEVLVK